MDEKAVKWAKEHRKGLLSKLTEGVDFGVETPTGVFMAGLPGSGKTEFTKNLIKDLKLKVVRIDMDEIAEEIEGYRPEKADEFRQAATLVMNNLYSEIMHKRTDFIMDGTFGSKNAILNIERAVSHGFQVKVIYVYQDPKLAWEFTRAREKIEHRGIDREGFIESYGKVTGNIRKVAEKMRGKISIDLVVKNADNQVGEWMQNIDGSTLDKVLNKDYNKESLRKYIDEK